MIRIYTTAPASYDYGYMTEVGTVVSEWDHRTYRILETLDDYRLFGFQIPRYTSGLYRTMTTEEWNKEGH